MGRDWGGSLRREDFNLNRLTSESGNNLETSNWISRTISAYLGGSYNFSKVFLCDQSICVASPFAY